MKRRTAGFTLLELLIGMTIGGFVLAAAITFFVLSFRQFKVQTKIVETNVEGVLGLELFRHDLENMGFGLPWNNLVGYAERPGPGVQAAITALDDTPEAPRAVVSIDCAAFTVNQSDYLVIRSARVGMDSAAGKWTTLTQANATRLWVPLEENLAAGDRVIVLRVGSSEENRRSLVTDGAGNPYTTFTIPGTLNFVPVEPWSANIIYGIRDAVAGAPIRPFNRAEYFVANAATNPAVTVPQHCAANTGVLVKAVVSHNDASGATLNVFPLLDCVADMQVLYLLDTTADGVPEPPPVDDIRAILPTAAEVRSQVVEVRVHLLVQEGQRDDSYQSPASLPWPGFPGRDFHVAGYRNYRWRVYSLVVKPRNLVQ